MTLSEFNLDNVTREIENWVLNYLDVPSDHYNGHKACPFAKKTLDKNEHRIEVTWEHPSKWYQEFAKDSKRIYIIAYKPDVIGLGDAVDELNHEWADKDVWGVAFEPSDEEPDDETLDPDEWGSIVDEAYPMLLIQSLSETEELSLSLDKKGYYKKCSPEFMDYVQSRKDLQNGRTRKR